MPFVSFHNKQIHYKASGRGNSTVVLLHGFLEDLSMWDELTQELISNHKIVAIDLLGHGKTDCVSETHTMELIAESILAVLQKENINSIQIIGHSMGGYVALALAQTGKVNVEKTILLNSSVLDDNPQKKNDRLRAIKALEKGKKQFINEAIPNLFADHNREKFPEEIEKAKQMALNTSPEGISAALLGMRERKDSTEWIKQSQHKAVFISGEYDNVIPIESSRQQAKNSNSEIYELKSCGHMAYIESKEACFNTIKEVL